MSFIKIQYLENKKWVPINFSRIKLFEYSLIIGKPFRILVDDLVVYHIDKNSTHGMVCFSKLKEETK